MATRECDRCGAIYKRPPALLGHYCSTACGYAARRKSDDELTAKYRMAYLPNHPLVSNSPYIPEHRALLYQAIGPGSHPCYRCGETVEWRPGGKVESGALVVDHLDGNTHNNALSNLAPACQRCNNLNGGDSVTDDEDYHTRPNGTRLRGERRNCERCGGEFITWGKQPEGKGRFCSRSCARKAQASTR